MIAFVQRAAGFALTGTTAEHKLRFLHGLGRNGKSVFLNTSVALTPHERYCQFTEHTACHRLRIATRQDMGRDGDQGLERRRLDDCALQTSWVFDIDPQMILMIAGNAQPSFRPVDEAIRARDVQMPYSVTNPPEQRDNSRSRLAI